MHADASHRAYLATYAALLGAIDDSGPDAALATFDSLDAGAVQNLNLTQVELHLLKDDWQAAQAALATTGISLQSILGDAYVMRLGLRATGYGAYADKIQKLVTWQNMLGVSHALMGELLLVQGNSAGAKARFLLAIKLDPALWPLKWRVQQIERTERVVMPAAGGTTVLA